MTTEVIYTQSSLIEHSNRNLIKIIREHSISYTPLFVHNNVRTVIWGNLR